MKVHIDQIRERLEIIEGRVRDLEETAKNQGGRSKRRENWRLEYLRNPYLIGAPSERVDARFCDIYMNAMELTEQGTIAPTSLIHDDVFIRKFAHLCEEYDLRSCLLYTSPSPRDKRQSRMPSSA